MYPSVNRQGLLGNFLGGRSPISYGPSPTGRLGTPGQIPGYDLRVSITDSCFHSYLCSLYETQNSFKILILNNMIIIQE